MRHLVPATLLLVALIHALPLVGVLGVNPLQRLYGVPVAAPELEILLRHRAVLFGLLAAFLAAAAFQPRLHGAALLAGLVSVLSFIVLVRLVGHANAALTAVMRVDAGALALLLLLAGAWHLWRPAGD
ncbi:phosphopantetheine adenylyltransferase [Ideonella sp. DXS22W]|uniref:Phosphopantetheine adenylyltransferase n=1 Tax=Pseudaquabacterium inlustre TaxID=2984192 RepID=A0ABU9CM63_9BURK